MRWSSSRIESWRRRASATTGGCPRPSSSAATTSRQEALDRLEEIGILTPNSRGYSPLDVDIVEAIGRFRAGGYDEQIGFTVYDTLRYKRALEELVKEEVSAIVERLAGEVEPDDAVALMEAGTEPMRDFIAALHSKLLLAELREPPRLAAFTT